jgi:ABC-2 type transport system permease protein
MSTSKSRVVAAQVRSSLLTAMQYRSDFVLDALVELTYFGTAVYPLFVVYENVGSIGGYSLDAALAVAGVFAILQGFMEGLISPSFMRLVEQVRKGTLDFVLTKPVDAQLLVSTAKFEPWRVINVVAGAALISRSLMRMHYAPNGLDLLVFLLTLTCSVAILYALWLIAACMVFYVARADNLTFLLASVFDLARWPRSVFRGPARIALTFLLPLGVMTSFPAEAIMGAWTPQNVAVSLSTALLLLLVSRWFFLRAASRYASASS